MNETTQQEKTTQLSSRNEQLNSAAGTKQLNSSVGTKQLNSALPSTAKPPATACNRRQPPATAYDRLHRLRPPATAYNRLQPPLQQQPPATACNRDARETQPPFCYETNFYSRIERFKILYLLRYKITVNID
ncbi:hypothetical protein TNCV_1685141 [Trichonephila clavipes]|nr:hypothetical protein TNCV_1685141 [Trichonephila clavipes]